MKKIILSTILFWLIIFGNGCDIDLITDTVYVPTPVYYVEPCCYDYVEVWIY